MSEPASRRRRPRLFCVSADPDVVQRFRAAFDEVADVQVSDDPEKAAHAFRTVPFAGALLDAQLPNRQAMRLAIDYLAHQPAGRVVIACVSAEATTLMSVAARDPRAEIVCDPWDLDELHERLLGPVGMGEFTGPQRRQVPARVVVHRGRR